MYAQLSAFRNKTKKNVYVLASHSHFVMNDAYNTACHKGDVLPGWIMGSAGAVRYRLPADRALSTIDKTDIYAYLLGTVAPDGTISFQVREVHRSRRSGQRGEGVYAGAGEVVLRAEQVRLHAGEPDLQYASSRKGNRGAATFRVEPGVQASVKPVISERSRLQPAVLGSVSGQLLAQAKAASC